MPTVTPSGNYYQGATGFQTAVGGFIPAMATVVGPAFAARQPPAPATQPAGTPVPPALPVSSATIAPQTPATMLKPAAPLPWQASPSAAPVSVAQAPTPQTFEPGMIGTPQQATVTNVATPSLLSDRVGQILADNSPLIQRARALANEQSNSRGMLNSSMAIGAADTAALDAAIPLATGDVNAINAVNAQNATAANTLGIANMDTANQLKATQAGLITSTNQANAAATNTVNLANTAAKNTAIIAQLDQANKIQLADIQASYNTVMQANSSAGNLFQTTMQALNNIQQSTTMDATTKQTAINQHVQLLKSGLSMFSAINNLDLSAGLNFSV